MGIYGRSSTLVRRIGSSAIAIVTSVFLSSCGSGRVIRVSNNTDAVLVDVQVRHRAEISKPVSIAPKAIEQIRLPWDDRDPYELLVSRGGALVVIGECRVKHRWVDGLTIWVGSLIPPKVECYEQG